MSASVGKAENTRMSIVLKVWEVSGHEGQAVALDGGNIECSQNYPCKFRVLPLQGC